MFFPCGLPLWAKKEWASKTRKELVRKTSEDFSEAAAETDKVSKLVEGIAVQAQEQAAAITQISIGIEQISSVVQMNSATSEESAAASEELSAQANMLQTLVANFELDGSAF